MINDPRVSTHSSLAPANDSERADTPVKLLYSKSKVYVHPSNNVNDFIPGYMSIVEKVILRITILGDNDQYLIIRRHKMSIWLLGPQKR